MIRSCRQPIVEHIRHQQQQHQNATKKYAVLPITTTSNTTTTTTKTYRNNNKYELITKSIRNKADEQQHQPQHRHNLNSTEELNYRQALVKTIYDFSSGVKQFGQNLIEYIGDFASDIQTLLTDAVDKIKSVIIVLGDKIMEDHNSAVRSLLIAIKDQFIEVENLFKDFMVLSNTEFRRVMEHVNNTLISFSQDMEVWSDEIKQKLKNVKHERSYAQGCKLVDALIRDSMKEMKNCCNIQIKPWISFCKSLKDMFGDILILSVDAVDKIDSCMVENRGRDGFMRCTKQIYDRIFELVEDAKYLKKRLIDNMPIKIMFSSCCISVSTYSVEVKKSQLERKLVNDFYYE